MRLLDFQILRGYINDLQKAKKMVIIYKGVEYLVKDIRKKENHSKTLLKLYEASGITDGILIGIPGTSKFMYIWHHDEEDTDLYGDIDISPYIYTEYSLWWTTIENIPSVIIQPIIIRIQRLLKLNLFSFLDSSKLKVSFLDKKVVGFIDHHPVFSIVDEEQNFWETKIIELSDIVAKTSSNDDNPILFVTTNTKSIGITPIPYLNSNSTFSGIRMKDSKENSNSDNNVTTVPVFLKAYLNGVLYTCFAVLIPPNTNSVIIDGKGKEFNFGNNELLSLEILSESFME
jgi:hypothetical protein